MRDISSRGVGGVLKVFFGLRREGEVLYGTNTSR